jgi:F0F1-type ATP synthase beta subunit
MDSSTDHAPFIRFAYLDSTTVLPKGLDSEGIYPTADLKI